MYNCCACSRNCDFEGAPLKVSSVTYQNLAAIYMNTIIFPPPLSIHCLASAKCRCTTFALSLAWSFSRDSAKALSCSSLICLDSWMYSSLSLCYSITINIVSQVDMNSIMVTHLVFGYLLFVRTYVDDWTLRLLYKNKR